MSGTVNQPVPPSPTRSGIPLPPASRAGSSSPSLPPTLTTTTKSVKLVPPPRRSPGRKPKAATTLPAVPVPPVRPPSPTARSVLLNLTNTTGSSVGTNVNVPPIKVISPASTLPLRPVGTIMSEPFEIRDYQGLIQNTSLENELLNLGYAPHSRIVVRMDSGEKRTQYIKAINKKGQKVFILVDVTGYTTARESDLTLIEAHNATIVPYSLKTGAYNCAGKEVCGVAFECGADSVCVLARGYEDLTPKETNFVFVEQPSTLTASIEDEGTIMTYPVIRLSEIRTNPCLVLDNTDKVTRRLRNTAYISLLEELATAEQTIAQLNQAFVHFNCIRESNAQKLNQTLTQLEQWNDEYMAHPPTTDAGKDKYRRLQYNLAQRNEGISTLLRSMKKVADKRLEMEALIKSINEISSHCEKEFATVEYATSD